MYIELYQDHATWWWRIVDPATQRVICRGSETFITPEAAEAAADRLVSSLRGDLKIGERRQMKDGTWELIVVAEYQPQGSKEE